MSSLWQDDAAVEIMHIGGGMEKYWQVSVSIAGEDVLVIGDNYLSGREDVANYADTIAGCAEHLLSFIGRKSQGQEAAEEDNARLLQPALASQRDAEKLLEKLHAVEREEKWLREKCAEFLRRAEAAESELATLRGYFEQFKRHWAEDDRDITALSEGNERLEKELAEAVQTAEANIRAEIADGGRSCHWCLDTTARKERERCISAVREACRNETVEFQEQAARNDGRQSDMAFGSINTAERLAVAIVQAIDVPE